MPERRRVLVTGGAGFIGTNFVYDRLANTDEDITVLDALTYAGHLSRLCSAYDHSRFHFVRGDIDDCDLVESLLAERKIDTIVHFAAETHVDRSITSPHKFVETNVVGTHQLLRAASKVWLGAGSTLKNHLFHQVSTDEVFGSRGLGERRCPESAAYKPSSPYAASKAASDHLVRAYHRTYGLRVTTSLCSNNYGPYQAPDKLIPLVITSILQDQFIPIYGDGMQMRDWLHVGDHVRCIGLILDRGRVGQTYNISSGCELTNVDVVEKICRMLDKCFDRDKSLWRRFPMAKNAIAGTSIGLRRHVTDRPGHDYRYAIDASRSRRELGFEAAMAIDAGLEHTIRWYLDNSQWWRDVVA